MKRLAFKLVLATALLNQSGVAAPGTASGSANFPPSLPGGRERAIDRSPDLLKPAATLRREVVIAREPPEIEFMFFPGQDYPGKPWSAWGDSLVHDGKYYATIGDHLAPRGNAFVYEYDPHRRTLTRIFDLGLVLALPEDHYRPGKIHGRLDADAAGWLYFATHRGSPRVTTDAFHFQGDWILRQHPGTGKSQVLAAAPIPKHSIPCTVFDPLRGILYGGTVPGADSDVREPQFFAFDTRTRRMRYAGPQGPARALILSRATGRVYFVAGQTESPIYRFDPVAGGPPSAIEGALGLRAATEETAGGYVYTVSSGQGGTESVLYSFDTRAERIESLGPAAIGGQQYIASLDVAPSGRYLYYVPGAHGGSDRDGSPVVQFDIRTRQKKVLAFLHPYYERAYGCALKGTYSAALDAAGAVLYITWNTSRGGRAWDCCALTVVHIPERERQP